MLYYTVGQWRIFIVMLTCGMVCGAWYGILMRMQRFLCAGMWLAALFDVWIASGIWGMVVIGLLVSNYGEIRLYALLAALFGFALYRLTIARAFGFLFQRVHLGITQLTTWFAKQTLVKKILK